MNNIRQQLTAMNTPQNMGQREYDRPNMVGNLSIESPTVEQLNAAISGCQTPQAKSVEPAFGEHATEAVNTLKRIFGR